MNKQTRVQLKIGMLVLTLVIASLMVGCAKAACPVEQFGRGCIKNEAFYNRIHPTFHSYLREYDRIFKPPYFVVIKLVDKMPEGASVVGVCNINYRNIPYRNIEILRSYWFSVEPLEREALLWHEFHHCLHDLKHAGANEISLMAPTLPRLALYRELRLHYQREALQRIRRKHSH